MTNLDQYLLAAIEQGKLSKSESGRLSPMVGAVLLRDNVLVEKAHRGELGDGDHAEFTLLQKKLPDEDLRGTVLVTTLEPCTKRNNHKPCYEWIIERGIGKVIIGMLDPNPHIYGKGRIQLRNAKVEIEMFPAALRNEVECDNRTFIEKFSANPALVGKATFNYNDNNQRFTIGHGDCIFETAWSSAGASAIHAYNDPASIRSIALAEGDTELSHIADATIYNYSSRSRTVQEGQILVLQNTNGYYAAIKIVDVKHKGHGDPCDSLEIEYRILDDHSADFSQMS